MSWDSYVSIVGAFGNETVVAVVADERSPSQCSTQFAVQNENISSYGKNSTRTRSRLISSSINPDGKPPCRKVLWEGKIISSYENYPNSNRLDKPNLLSWVSWVCWWGGMKVLLQSSQGVGDLRSVESDNLSTRGTLQNRHGWKICVAPSHVRLVRTPVTDPGLGPGNYFTRPEASGRASLNQSPGPAPLGAARP